MTGVVTATGVGCNLTQLSGTSIPTRYPNTNTFTGGRMGQYGINWKLAGNGNRLIGVASESAALKGTAFHWYAPVANSNVANVVISPYVEIAEFAFQVDPLSLLPSVDRHYVTGVATQIADPGQKLGIIGGDGIRGIRLPAVAGRSGISLGNVANADLSTLDWYQEGSITPLITGTTTEGTGTYSGQFGGFTRIGNRVFYDLFVAWTAHTGTGSIQVDLNDIPFQSSASSNRYGGFTVRANTLAYTAGKNLTGYMSSGSKKLNIEVQDPAGGTTTGVALDATASLMITGSFLV